MAPSPVGYVVVQTTTKKLVQLGEIISRFHHLAFSFGTMCFEELMVVSICLLFSVERSNAAQAVQQGVRVPLLCFLGDECVSKEILFYVAGGAVIVFRGGRTTHGKSRQQIRDFDATMGFPGEDIRC